MLSLNIYIHNFKTIVKSTLPASQLQSIINLHSNLIATLKALKWNAKTATLSVRIRPPCAAANKLYLILKLLGARTSYPATQVTV